MLVNNLCSLGDRVALDINHGRSVMKKTAIVLVALLIGGCSMQPKLIYDPRAHNITGGFTEKDFIISELECEKLAEKSEYERINSSFIVWGDRRARYYVECMQRRGWAITNAEEYLDGVEVFDHK